MCLHISIFFAGIFDHQVRKSVRIRFGLLLGPRDLIEDHLIVWIIPGNQEDLILFVGLVKLFIAQCRTGQLIVSKSVPGINVFQRITCIVGIRCITSLHRIVFCNLDHDAAAVIEQPSTLKPTGADRLQ